MSKVFRNFLLCGAILFVVATAGFSVYGVGGILSPFEQKDIEVVSTELFMPGVTAAEEHELQFRVHNPTGRAVRLLGTDYTCGYNCCLRAKLTEPVAVPPGETGIVAYMVRPGKAGEFHNTMTLFIDNGSLKETTLTVRGEAIAPASASISKAAP